MAPTKSESIIMVLGVGGAGGNAVNHMFDLGIKDVTFMVCNTDKQALANSPIENKLQLGAGLGAGNSPTKGRAAAIESLNEIMIHLENSGAKMIFITAGMGGGTGTGAAPVIAKAAKGKGILTVGIVTLPFHNEGKQRVEQAAKGLEELKANTDALVVINNDNITKMYGTLPFVEALHKADDVLATAAKGIAELVTRHGIVNVDFADVHTVMLNSGMAHMGSARASGEGKIEKAVNMAIASPLLNNQDIRGAKKILLNLSYASGDDLTLDEANLVWETVQKHASRGFSANNANLIWGAGESSELQKGEIEVTIVATGFEQTPTPIYETVHVAPKDLGAEEENGGEEEVELIPQGPTEPTQQPGWEWKIEEQYNQIDTVLMQPAFFRRGFQLDGMVKGATVQVVNGQVGQKVKEQQPTATEGTLFSLSEWEH